MTETAKRQFIHEETIDFGSIGAGATADVLVNVGVPNVLAAFVNPPDGIEADLVLTAFAVSPRNEVQNLTNDGTGGTFTLTFGGEETLDIPFDASAAVLEDRLERLSTIGGVAVTLNGAQDWDIEFQSPGFEDVALLTADDTNMTGQLTGSVVTEVTKGRTNDTVIVRCANVSSGAIDPASQDFKVICLY